jgi:tol-pal system protein YbgF
MTVMRRRTGGRLPGIGAAALIGVIGLAGCQSQNNVEAMRRDMAQLRQEMASLSRANEASRTFTEDRLGRLEAEFKKNFDASVQESQTSRTALSSRLEDTAGEVRTVQGKLEENAFAVRNVQTRLEDLDQRLGLVARRTETMDAQLKTLDTQAKATDQQLQTIDTQTKATDQQLRVLDGQVRALDQQVRILSQPSAAAPMGTAPPAVPPAAAPPPAGGMGAAPTPPTTPGAPAPALQASLPPEELYRNALADYTKGNYDQAIAGFRSYLQAYPKTSLAANAQYWLGESYYGQKDYAKAVQEFEGVIRDYPENPKVPSALFKQGEAYLQVGDTKRAGEALCELLGKYPRTREARLARERNIRCR